MLLLHGGNRILIFMKRYLLYISLIILCALPAGRAFAEWNNFIVNFDKSAYGKGGQTWEIAPYNEKWVFFANRNGMLQFDGNVWGVFPLNNASDVRSVLPSVNHKRIYVGGINEYGYYEPGTEGALRYHCLSDTLEGDSRFLGNVWNIHESDNILYFQGDDRVVRYLNGKFTPIVMDAKIECSNLVDGILYIGTNKGVWVLVGNTFFPLQGAEILSSMRIRDLIPFRGGVLAVTAYDGLFYFDGRKLTPFVTGAETFMRTNEVFCAAVQGDKIVLGTIHKGLLLIDTATMHVKYFNENNGLHNNTVLSVAFDKAGNLWAGLDSGIDYVCLTSPFTNLYSYPNFYGAGYTAIVEGGILYLGTNRGLYYTSYPVTMDDNLPDIRPVPQSSGQVWNLCRVGDELFCLHDRGLFLLQGTRMQRVTDLGGVWCCRPVAGHADKMFVGVYSGIYLLEKKQGEWQVAAKIDGIVDSGRFFEQEAERVLWLSTTEHVCRIRLDETLTRVEEMKYYTQEDGLPSLQHVYVSKVDGQICFATPQGVYRYNGQKDAIEPYDDLNTALNGTSSYMRLLEHDGRIISLNPHEVCIAHLGKGKQGFGSSINSIQQALLEPVPDFENIVPVSDSLMVIPNEKGFALFTLSPQGESFDRNKALYIRNMYLSYPKDSLVYTANYRGEKVTPRVAYALNSIRFEYGLPFMMTGDDVRFQYRLNGENWSDYTTMNTKEYSNLSEGSYTFEVKAVFPDGTTSADAISFTILPPWYRSTPAYVLYVMLLILALWYLYRWDDLRMQRKKAQAVVEKDKEMHEMEKVYEEEKARQERQIVQLEKEKLEYDLQHKSQEMANLMINFVRKNEMLNEIKSEILKVASALKGDGARDGKQQLILINSKIDANIQGDEVLQRIEEQFDLIHNNFMKRLHAKHPELSNNERMMCAYLKMNLSTKEIAPLLNISVRGVETIRYRLRKKFALEREESLTDYLNNRM